MTRILKRLALGLLLVVLIAAGWAWQHWRAQLPQRDGTLSLAGLSAPVDVRWDEWGVPHLQAQNETDLYRALGYLHAQDRLFQMEMVRRLARGELAAVLGPKLLDTDRLFRTLRLRHHADAYVAQHFAQIDTPAKKALVAYLDGINHYQASRPRPVEFEILGITPRPFTPADTVSVAGYLAYSFAAAFRTEPVLTHVRDQLGPDYLKIFDLDWHPQGPMVSAAARRLSPDDWQGLSHLAQLSQDALALAGLPQFEGSNAWAISGPRTHSGKPLLAGDPHIAFSTPAVWWEAHLKSPGFELYGHFQALNPGALLGHNQDFGWSLTMFQNDDIDLIVEKPNPDNPNQVWHQGRWVDLVVQEDLIQVKGQPDERLSLRRSPHGPIVNDAIPGHKGNTPIALWWAFLETDNPVLDAFYQLNRADTLAKAREAASLIHAPGLNVVWANSRGDIGWWAAAKLPRRPEGVNPSFMLDGASRESEKLGFEPFSHNPQEENPLRGYIMSANHQPTGTTPVPGYYNLWDRAQRLDQALKAQASGWTQAQAQALQLDVTTGYAQRVLQPLLPLLRQAAQNDNEKAWVERLAQWQGDHPVDAQAPVLFHQLVYELSRAALADELGDALFDNLRRTRALDHALPRLMASPESPWWDRRGTPEKETQGQIVTSAWQAALKHLDATLGSDRSRWTWGQAHTLTHAHPLGAVQPLDRVFNVGPLPAPGSHEVPNNLAQRIGPAPWAVTYGPSTRRVIDFAQPAAATGINPVGQSGVWGDRHYADQAPLHVSGQHRGQYLAEADVVRHTRSQLQLQP